MDSLRPNKIPEENRVNPQKRPPRKMLQLGSEFPSSTPGRELLRSQNRQPKISWRKFFLTIAAIFLVVLIGETSFLFSKAAHISRNISLENQKGISLFAEISRTAQSLFTSHPELKNTDGRINILLLGRAGEHYPGRNLTDTIMLASIDTKTHKVALLSFPRDLYAPIGQSEQYTKINAIYQIGLDTKEGIGLLRETIENISGIPIHYSVILDFDGFEKAIDALGGISVDVPRNLYDTRYPGKNYSYETFEIHQGWQKLDGATALKYVRERHDDPEGDFGRAKRQQQVMQATRDKVFSTGTFLNILTLSRLLDALGESVKTDLTPEEMEGFLLLIRTLDTKNITTSVIDAWKPESLLRVSHIPTPSGNAFVLVPRTGNWKEITNRALHIFEIDSQKKEQGRIEEESPSIRLIASSSNTTLTEALRKFIREELHFSSVIVETNRFQNAPERSIIADMTKGQKPYSENALLSRLDLQPEVGNSASSFTTGQTDFILTIGNDLEGSAFQGELGTAPEEATNDILPPQEPVKKSSKKH